VHAHLADLFELADLSYLATLTTAWLILPKQSQVMFSVICKTTLSKYTLRINPGRLPVRSGPSEAFVMYGLGTLPLFTIKPNPNDVH
jgi:hypothetical protein